MTNSPAEDVDHVPTEPTPPQPSTPEPRRRLLPTGFVTIRDIITFTIGTVIVCNEVFLQGKVEMTAVAIGAAMMGLPLVFNADEKRKNPPPSDGTS